MNLDELQDAKALTKYTLAQQEKDYYQCKILSFLSDSGGLVFKGGTALQKAYGLPRFSEDLDFNATEEDYDVKPKVAKIAAWLSAGGDKCVVKDEKEFEGSYSARLSIEGMLFRQDPRGRCGIALDISFREKVSLAPDAKELAPKYPDILPFLFAIMEPEEIAAEKIRAIMTRQKARDLYDLHFLLCSKGVKLDKSLATKKLQFYGKKYGKAELEGRIEKLGKIWKSELKDLVRELPVFLEVKKELLAKLP